MSIELRTSNTTQQQANVTHVYLKKGEYTKNIEWPYDGFFLINNHNKTNQLVLIVNKIISKTMSLSKGDEYNTILHSGGSLR